MITWTQELVELVTRLWREGYSGTEISNRISGSTRNGIIGKVYRLKLETRRPAAVEPARGRHWRIKPKRKANFSFGASSSLAPKGRAKSVSAVAERPLTTAEPVPPGERIALLDLKSHHCRYPFGRVGDPDFGFCGRQTHRKTSWCAEHIRVVAIPATKKNLKALSWLT